MIVKAITDVLEILAVSFAVVLLAVQVLPKERSNVVKLQPRQSNLNRWYKKVRKAS